MAAPGRLKPRDVIAARGTAVQFAYTGIEVRDMDKSIQFYREPFGMELLDRHPIPETGGEVAALKSRDAPQLLELNWYAKSRYRAGSELDHLAFEVGDVRKEVRRLRDLGAELARPVEVRAKFIVGFVKDPNGIWLELFEPRKSGASPAVSGPRP